MTTTDKLAEALRLSIKTLEDLQGGCTDSNDGTVEALTVWCPEVITQLYIALDAYEAEAKPAEPVAYWFRHINTEGEPTDDWKPVKANDFYMQTVEDSVRELLAYRYEGKPCYEVMPLYAAPAAPAPAWREVAKELERKLLPAELVARIEAHGGTRHRGEDARITCTYDQAARAILDITGLDVEWAAPAAPAQVPPADAWRARWPATAAVHPDAPAPWIMLHGAPAAPAEPVMLVDGLTPHQFALRELYEFQQATGCDTAAEFAAAPAAPSTAIAGALFDFLGFLTTSERRWTFSSTDDAGPAVAALEQWAAKRSLSLDDADVEGWSVAPAAPSPDDEPTCFGAGDVVRIRDTALAVFHGKPQAVLDVIEWYHASLLGEVGVLAAAPAAPAYITRDTIINGVRVVKVWPEGVDEPQILDTTIGGAPAAPADLCERICAAIVAEDTKSVDEAGYMLDSNDCCRIVREQFAAAPAAPAPHPDTKDAERYRWLKHECDTRGSRGSRIVQSQWGLEWDGAIDAAIAASKKEKA
jgi:hypothetical protein